MHTLRESHECCDAQQPLGQAYGENNPPRLFEMFLRSCVRERERERERVGEGKVIR